MEAVDWIFRHRGGREVQVVLNFAGDGGQQRFYDYVAGQFNRS